MAKQSPEQIAAFQQLCRENGLDPKADVWQQQQSGTWIIGRTGIEKIQYKNNIAVTFDMVSCLPDYACVKATATRTLEGKGATAKKLVVESFGSAIPGNCRINYYAEMAEKRALSRAVLKNMGFYALGVYGEDEADDFKRPAQPAPAAETPAKPAAGNAPAASASPSPAPSTTSGPSSDEGYEAPSREEVLAAIAACTSTVELKAVWKNEAKHWQLDTTVREAFATKGAAIKQAIEADLAATRAQQATPPLSAPESRPAADAQGQPISYATGEQVQEIQRLLNHPMIQRGEKTKTYLTINTLTGAAATAKIAELRATIEGRENDTERQGVAEGLRKWVSQNKALIHPDEANRLRLLADTLPTSELHEEWGAARRALTEAKAAA